MGTQLLTINFLSFKEPALPAVQVNMREAGNSWEGKQTRHTGACVKSPTPPAGPRDRRGMHTVGIVPKHGAGGLLSVQGLQSLVGCSLQHQAALEPQGELGLRATAP